MLYQSLDKVCNLNRVKIPELNDHFNIDRLTIVQPQELLDEIKSKFDLGCGILLIDNFDSFTYNLVQCLQILGKSVHVVRNNVLTVQECQKLNPSHLVISPGPGDPSRSGISKDLVCAYAGKIPILGVCLGHQCIAEIYGAKVVRSKKPMHGKTSRIYHDNQGVFAGIPQGFIATRYHSLIVESHSLPPCLQVSAETEEGEIMGIRHKEHFMEGVQFHPESIASEYGMQLLQNIFI